MPEAEGGWGGGEMNSGQKGNKLPVLLLTPGDVIYSTVNNTVLCVLHLKVAKEHNLKVLTTRRKNCNYVK